jgi:hypothetical protein
MELDAFSLSAIGSVLAISGLHAAIGPDHYLPFILLGRARKWSLRRTLLGDGGVRRRTRRLVARAGCAGVVPGSLAPI